VKFFKFVWLTIPVVTGLALGQQVPGVVGTPNHYSQGNLFINFSEKAVSENGDVLHDKYHEITSQMIATFPLTFSNDTISLVGGWVVFVTYKYGDEFPDQKVIDILTAEARVGARTMPVYTLTITPRLNAETTAKDILGRIAKAVHAVSQVPASQIKPSKL
jgi:hypothetical protein